MDGWMDGKSDRQIDRQTDSQTDRHPDGAFCCRRPLFVITYSAAGFGVGVNPEETWVIYVWPAKTAFAWLRDDN